MDIKLLVVAALTALPLLVWLPFWWRAHRYASAIAIMLTVLATGAFLYIEPSIWSGIYATITLYAVLNFGRIIRNRMQADYLRRVTRQTGLSLTAVQLGLCLAAQLDTAPDMTIGTLIYVSAGTQIIIAAILLRTTTRQLRKTKTLQATQSYTDHELPTVSVLIPARNETNDLASCLDALVASDYPKLEIIVLDDCSQDKRTPEIIRRYAQSGVRFIAGKAPEDNWLAKNYAYQQLADAASGEYLLFCGVDLRMTPGAIRELMTTLLEKQKVMLSLLPKNALPTSWRSLLIQPIRYAWELSLPRRLFNRPPILSTCWIIKRSFLMSVGGFKATSRSIVPEGHFARAAAHQDGYSFLRSNLLVSDKPVDEQFATTIRMRYPQLHRRVEFVWGLTLIELVGIVLPLPLAAVFLVSDHLLASALSLASYVITCVVYMQVSGVMYGRLTLLSTFLSPLAAAYDIALLNYSMYRYEFRDVRWKERNICLPIMRFDVNHAHLPSAGSAQRS